MKKQFILSIRDQDHKLIKVNAAMYGVTMNDFIVASVKFYVSALAEKAKQPSDKDSQTV